MPDTDRSDKILALVLLNSIRSAPQQEKIVQLNLAGFSNLEIANLLQTTAAVVAQSLYAARKQGPKGSRATRRTKKATRRRA